MAYGDCCLWMYRYMHFTYNTLIYKYALVRYATRVAILTVHAPVRELCTCTEIYDRFMMHVSHECHTGLIFTVQYLFRIWKFYFHRSVYTCTSYVCIYLPVYTSKVNRENNLYILQLMLILYQVYKTKYNLNLWIKTNVIEFVH